MILEWPNSAVVEALRPEHRIRLVERPRMPHRDRLNHPCSSREVMTRCHFVIHPLHALAGGRSGILRRRDLVVEPELPLQKQVHGSDLQSSELLASQPEPHGQNKNCDWANLLRHHGQGGLLLDAVEGVSGCRCRHRLEPGDGELLVVLLPGRPERHERRRRAGRRRELPLRRRRVIWSARHRSQSEILRAKPTHVPQEASHAAALANLISPSEPVKSRVRSATGE